MSKIRTVKMPKSNVLQIRHGKTVIGEAKIPKKYLTADGIWKTGPTMHERKLWVGLQRAEACCNAGIKDPSMRKSRSKSGCVSQRGSKSKSAPKSKSKSKSRSKTPAYKKAARQGGLGGLLAGLGDVNLKKVSPTSGSARSRTPQRHEFKGTRGSTDYQAALMRQELRKKLAARQAGSWHTPQLSKKLSKGKARAPVRTDWANTPEFQAAMARFDMMQAIQARKSK